MAEYQRDHEVGSPAMYATQKPSQGDVRVEILQAVPGLTGRRYVNRRQHDTGEDLQQKHRKRGAAEDVQPTRRPPRYLMRSRFADPTGDLQSLLEPVPNLPQP